MNGRTLQLALAVCLALQLGADGLNAAEPRSFQDVQNAVVADSLLVEVEALRTEVGRLQELTERLEESTALVTQAQPLQSALPADAAAELTLGQAAESARLWGVRSLMAVIVVVVTLLVVRGASWVIVRLAERRVRQRLMLMRIEPIVRTLLWVLAILVVLKGVFQVDAATLLAAGAAVGLAVGFAAQDIVKNIFGSLVIIADRPFQVGDKISVGGTYGEVTQIGTRSTRIVTPDDSIVSVPNKQIMDEQVSNANSGALDCQVVTDLYLPGWVDISLAKDIAFRAAITSRYVYRKKPVVVLVKDEIHDTFVTHLKVKAYVLDIRFEFAFMSEVTERARAAFRDEGLLPPWHGAKPYLLLDPHASASPWGPDAPEPQA